MSTAGGSGWRGIALEVDANLGEGIGCFEVTDDSQHRVVRRVVHFEERSDVFDTGRIQIIHRTDGRVLVSEVVVDQLLLDFAALAVRPGCRHRAVVLPERRCAGCRDCLW